MPLSFLLLGVLFFYSVLFLKKDLTNVCLILGIMVLMFSYFSNVASLGENYALNIMGVLGVVLLITYLFIKNTFKANLNALVVSILNALVIVLIMLIYKNYSIDFNLIPIIIISAILSLLLKSIHSVFLFGCFLVVSLQVSFYAFLINDYGFIVFFDTDAFNLTMPIILLHGLIIVFKKIKIKKEKVFNKL